MLHMKKKGQCTIEKNNDIWKLSKQERKVPKHKLYLKKKNGTDQKNREKQKQGLQKKQRKWMNILTHEIIFTYLCGHLSEFFHCYISKRN